MLAVVLLATPATLHAAGKPGAKPAASTVAVSPKITATPKRIVAANLHAAATIYRAAVLEEMKLFAVADRIVSLFAAGLLPVANGTRDRIHDYTSGESAALSESSRRRIYGHVLGGASLGPGHHNDDFDPLLARFLVVTDQLAKPEKRGKADDELHRAARALALNLSNHGYGAATDAARLLARKIELAQAIVADPEVLGTYGVSDPQLLVERIAEQEFGATVDTEKLRARAQAGAAVLEWLAKVAEPLSSAGGAPEVAADLVKSGVPGSVRGLDRSVKAKHAPKAADPEHPQIHALCFDAKQGLVDCIVETSE